MTEERLAKVANRLVVARDGVEALDLLFRDGGAGEGPLRPVVVLLDLELPRVDGLQVLERIRGNALTEEDRHRSYAGLYWTVLNEPPPLAQER